MIKKLIPDYYFKSIYDIPLEELYKKGIRLILTDLDNTLISYSETDPSNKLFEFKKKIEVFSWFHFSPFSLLIIRHAPK